jgi:AcrR family transcriptional regulator
MSATLAAQLARFIADDTAAPADAAVERILDAALEQFQSVGLRRSSMEDVARRAGLSRITIYRRFPQKDRLLEALLLRECRRLLGDMRALMLPLATQEQRIVEGFSFALRTMRGHPLLQRLMALQAGPVVAIVSGFIAQQIRDAQRRGEVPAYDPRPVAEILTRIAQSLILTPQGGVPLDSERQARAFARDYIVPIVMRVVPAGD